jgi:hypothetical protein
MRYITHMDALLSIIQTIFVCTVLTAGAIIFAKDANDLVVGPIEQMMFKIQRIVRNPVEAAKEEENEAVAMHQYEREERQREKSSWSCFKVFVFVKLILINRPRKQMC